MLRVSKMEERLGPRAHGDDCQIIRPDGRLCVDLPGGSRAVSADTVPGMRPHLALLAPGTRGTPHFHAGQATTICVVSGQAEVWHGTGLARRSTARAGDIVCIPPGIPHLTVNRGDVTAIAVVTLADQPDRAGTVVIALPRHLAGLLDIPIAAGA